MSIFVEYSIRKGSDELKMKDSGKEQEVLTFQALDQRIAEHHLEKERVQRDLKVKIAEVSGEKEIEYTLGFLDEKRYLILHNLRLPDQNGHFQIDTLLLSEYFYLVIDAKNWLGTVIFGSNGQVTRIDLNGKEKGFKNPASQTKTQSFRLHQWMKNHKLPNMFIENLAVISFPKTIIKPSSPNITIPYEVIHNSDLVFRIKELERKHKKSMVPMNQLMGIANILIKAHEPLERDIYTTYQISSNDLIKGVYCPKCQAIPMMRHKRKWYCRRCKTYSEDAHISALNDYFLLIGDRVSNREVREFLRVESPDVVKRIMKKTGYRVVGNNKGRKYILKLRLGERRSEEER